MYLIQYQKIKVLFIFSFFLLLPLPAQATADGPDCWNVNKGGRAK